MTIADEVVLRGGGGHAKVVIDSLLAEGRRVVGIFDKQRTEPLFSIPLVAGYDATSFRDACMIIAIGDNATRQRISAEVTHRFTNTIHPSGLLSSFSSLGVGCMILHGAIVQADVKIGNHVILNTGSQVDHDCVIDDFAHIAPRATLCGNVRVAEGSLVGAGAVILPGVRIGKWVTVAAGSVVRSDVPDYAVVAGIPAVIKKYNQLWQ